MAQLEAVIAKPKKKMGRPSTLTLELVEKARTYLEWNRKNPLEIDRVVSPDDPNIVISVKQFPRLPSYAGLACYLGVGKDTLVGWGDLLSEEGKEIRNVLNDIKATAERMLMEVGFSGKGNALFNKFLLSAAHGYREKSETDITSGGKPLAILGGITQAKE